MPLICPNASTVVTQGKTVLIACGNNSGYLTWRQTNASFLRLLNQFFYIRPPRRIKLQTD